MAIAFGGFALLTGFALRYIRRTAVKLAEGEDRLRHLALHDPSPACRTALRSASASPP